MIDPGPDHTESQGKGDSQRSSMNGSVNGRAANGTPAADLECSLTCLPAHRTVAPLEPNVVPSSVGFPKTMFRSVFDFAYDTILPINLISSSLCCYLRVKT